ncbi:hypothetical protein MESS4_120190 [Mesorhizobium sp. STM 4661]|nr:hypothetical protein MESS4_120190 [Mesorhizobium sp. STM 4661]
MRPSALRSLPACSWPRWPCCSACRRYSVSAYRARPGLEASRVQVNLSEFLVRFRTGMIISYHSLTGGNNVRH